MCVCVCVCYALCASHSVRPGYHRDPKMSIGGSQVRTHQFVMVCRVILWPSYCSCSIYLAHGDISAAHTDVYAAYACFRLFSDRARACFLDQTLASLQLHKNKCSTVSVLRGVGSLDGSHTRLFCLLVRTQRSVNETAMHEAVFLAPFIVYHMGDLEPPQDQSVLAAGIPEGWSNPVSFYEIHKIEFLLGGMMFWFMGGRVSAERSVADKNPSLSLIQTSF